MASPRQSKAGRLTRLTSAQKVLFWDILRSMVPEFTRRRAPFAEAAGDINKQLKAKNADFLITADNIRAAIRDKVLEKAWDGAGRPVSEFMSPGSRARAHNRLDDVDAQLAAINKRLDEKSTAATSSATLSPQLAGRLEEACKTATSAMSAAQAVAAVLKGQEEFLTGIQQQLDTLSEKTDKVRSDSEAAWQLLQQELVQLRQLINGTQAQLGFLAAAVQQVKSSPG